MASNLMMHCDPTRVEGLTIADLRKYATPLATESHVPIGHATMRDMIVDRLAAVGLGIKSEQIAVSTRKDVVIDGEEHEAYSKAFGVFDVDGLDYAIDGSASMGLSVGWRNSSNKQLPAAVVVGSRVFVCDNLCFSGTLTLKRRHTKNIMDDLPDMIASAFNRVGDLADRQFRIYDRLRDVKVSQDVAAAVIMRACEMSGKGPLASKNVLPIWEFYNHVATDEEREAGLKFNRDLHGHGTAWALWNALTGWGRQYATRNLVETSGPLLTMHNVITARFAADLEDTDRTTVAITAATVRDEQDEEIEAEPTIITADEAEQVEEASDEIDREAEQEREQFAPDGYDESLEEDIIGGYADDEWEEV